MLRWLRLRKPLGRIERIAARPMQLLESYHPALARRLWRSPYCCTLVYFWTAVVTEDVCADRYSENDKRVMLQACFARCAKLMRASGPQALKCVLPDGDPRRRRALADLKRAIALYRGEVDEGLMIHPDYREAVEGDGRPARAGNRWGLRREAAHDILLARYLAHAVGSGPISASGSSGRRGRAGRQG